MNYGHDVPDIKLILNIKRFNILVTAIDNIINLNSDDISPFADRLKNKIMKYGIPRKDNDDTDIVDVRFFSKEIGDLMFVLSPYLDTKDEYHNYYLELDRHNYKKS